MSLRRIDLNLLPIFDVLIEERNTTHAAARLSMSQPAVSHALSRLRKQLGDPILVRGPTGMQASPRALEVHHEIQQALKQIEHTLTPEPGFDPASSTRSFVIATTDYVEAMLLPPLLLRIQEQAPGIEVIARHLEARLPLDKIDSGEIDMAIGQRVKIPKRYKTQPLLSDGYMCAVSKNHPEAGRKLTLQRYMKMQHLLVAPASQRKATAKALFNDPAAAPKAIANISHFLVALHATAETNLVLTGPTRLLKKFQNNFGLQISEAPFDLEPLEIEAVWHPFRSTDEGLTWLRKQLDEIAIELQHATPSAAHHQAELTDQ